MQLSQAQSVCSTIDAAYASTYAPLITSIQAAFFASSNRYWQGLVTHTSIPLDGANITPNNLSAAPGYEAQNWLQVGYPTANGQPAQIAVQAWIDQYSGPHGLGYCLTMQWQESDTGKIWRKVIDSGAEPGRNQDWSVVA